MIIVKLTVVMVMFTLMFKTIVTRYVKSLSLKEKINIIAKKSPDKTYIRLCTILGVMIFLDLIGMCFSIVYIVFFIFK